MKSLELLDIFIA